MAKTVIMQKIKAHLLPVKAFLFCIFAGVLLQACGAKGNLYQTPVAQPVSSQEKPTQLENNAAELTEHNQKKPNNNHNEKLN